MLQVKLFKCFAVMKPSQHLTSQYLLVQSNNRITIKSCGICSKLMKRRTERQQWGRSVVFVDFKQISQLIVKSSKCRLGNLSQNTHIYMFNQRQGHVKVDNKHQNNLQNLSFTTQERCLLKTCDISRRKTNFEHGSHYIKGHIFLIEQNIFHFVRQTL